MIVLWSRYSALFYSAIIAIGSLPMLTNGPLFKLIFIISLSLFVLGLYDFSQKKRPVLANFPIIGRFRFIFESIRPELRQYFWESDKDELPYSRNQRSMVYQRSKSLLAARPFGSDEDQYADDFTWLNHSISPTNISDDDFRVNVGEGEKSYAISVLNISGTSFGSLSPNAIQALSSGAKLGGFAHNTGEGSLSKYHQLGGGDTIWQISTGYFGCRTKDGKFDPVKFSEKANLDQVKMIEIKLSQDRKSVV